MNEVFIDGSSTLFNVNVFPMEAILKHKQVVCMRRKLLFSIFKHLFSFIKYDEKRYLRQSVSEKYSLQ